ncbi:MAG: hypothetical protein JWN40_5088 [Phycisphaerales bacterium]|nr:hypothetical protein [Phycisphaerales bacterium]
MLPPSPTYSFQPRKPSHRRPRATDQAPPAPPQTLVLVAASYLDSDWVQLTFDRAVNATALVAGQVNVNDGMISGNVYAGAGAAMMITPQTVQIGLAYVGPSGIGETLLTAGAGTGIVAVDDGGTWAGVADLSLPFG